MTLTETINLFSEKRNRKKNHTQALTIQKFRFIAADQTKKQQLFSRITAKLPEIQKLEGIDLPTFQDLKLNIREIKCLSDSIIFYINFHKPDSKVSSTPDVKDDPVGSTNVPRKNEAEMIVGIKGNNIYAGIMIAYWNSLRRHLLAFIEKIIDLDLKKTPITAYPNNDFLRQVRKKKIIGYGVAAEMSLAHLDASVRSPGFIDKICQRKKSPDAKVSGHIIIDAKLNPSILPDNIEEAIETTDLEEYLDEENFLLTSDNQKLYPREFLDRTTYFASPLTDKTILYKSAFAIMKYHISK